MGQSELGSTRSHPVPMKTVTLYVRRNCGLCRAARDVVEEVRERHPFLLQECDIDRDLDADDPRKSPYALDIPVVEVDGKVVFRHEVSADALARLVADPRSA